MSPQRSLDESQSAMQVAGTEQGVTEPEATFSACFGGALPDVAPP